MGPVLVSIIIPCYNEEGTIAALLEAILAQTIPVEHLEVIISDGMSTDHTREKISTFQAKHPGLEIRVLDNTKRTIPAALNQAIDASQGAIITRMDAHAIPAADYLEKSLAALNAGLGDNVGGVIDIRPGRETWIGRSIAVATAHPLGVGDALYRTAKKPTIADTVAFGTYKRSLVESIGKYDESLLANEDYEFNARIRSAGGKIWVDPAIRATYYSRPTLKLLARQYFTYGFWKYKMLKRYPATLRWRQALPPVFVLGILMLLLLSIFWIPARICLVVVACLYPFILMIGSIRPTFNKKKLTLGIVMIAIMTMHFSWGSGFLWSMIKKNMTGKPNGN